MIHNEKPREEKGSVRSQTSVKYLNKKTRRDRKEKGGSPASVSKQERRGQKKRIIKLPKNDLKTIEKDARHRRQHLASETGEKYALKNGAKGRAGGGTTCSRSKSREVNGGGGGSFLKNDNLGAAKRKNLFHALPGRGEMVPGKCQQGVQAKTKKWTTQNKGKGPG